MATVRYTVLNGRMIAEKRGGVRRYYSHDALGHTVAMYDNTQTKADTFTYWPYGEVRTSTGTTPTKYKTMGAWGCRTQVDGSVKPLRDRELATSDGRFRTVDMAWPKQAPYRYAHSAPLNFVDMTGLKPWWSSGVFVREYPDPLIGPPLPGKGPVAQTCADWEKYVFAVCYRCHTHPTLGCQSLCNQVASTYYRTCKDPGRIPKPGEVWVPKPGLGIVPIRTWATGTVPPCSLTRLGDAIDYECDKEFEDCMERLEGICGSVEGQGFNENLDLICRTLCGAIYLLCQGASGAINFVRIGAGIQNSK